MEMKVYIANLGKYNEGELQGAWFTPPIDFDNVKEQIGLNAEYEDYAIHEYDLPFDVEEVTSIDRINQLYALVNQIDNEAIVKNLQEVKTYFGFSTIEEVAENIEDLKIHHSDSLSDLAEKLISNGHYGEVPEKILCYVDYDDFAKDMEIEGNYLELSNCIIEYTG